MISCITVRTSGRKKSPSCDSLVDSKGRLDLPFLVAIAAQFAAIAKVGFQPVLVTSGAVASGVGILGLAHVR